MRRIDDALIGKGQQLIAERVVQETAEVGGRPPERYAQIGTADISDKQRIAGQDRLRCADAAIEIVDGEANRLGRVPRCLDRLQSDTPEVDDVAVVERREFVLCSSGRPQVNRRANPIAQLEVAGDEISVKFIPARNGSPLGFLKSVTMPDGRVIQISAGNAND